MKRIVSISLGSSKRDKKVTTRFFGEEFEIELKNFSKSRLPGFARPEWVEIVDALPKTSTGKIQKQGEGEFVPYRVLY